MADRLNQLGSQATAGEKWSKSLIYNLRIRNHWHNPRPHNIRPHSDEEVRDRIVELHNGDTLPNRLQRS